MTFYFYDLETTGFNPRSGRIMQFGGQRTTLDLKPIGQPDNILIKITPDILPDPQAVLITGITPQKTLAGGTAEREFTHYFNDKIVLPETIFVGFNSVRFDDEFMRHLLYRNFYDAYEWQWKNGCSRWDLLDVVRMTRALRPGGIKWPVNSDGVSSNQLGLLASVNKLTHSNAHDALSDVMVTIDLARLLRRQQPKLFNFMLNVRTKDEVVKVANEGHAFVYTSGKYPSEFEKTTVVTKIADHPRRQGVLVYDLRHDPTEFAKLTPAQLAEAWQRRDPAEGPILPVKTLQFNRCPAVAPLSVLDEESQDRLKLNMLSIETNLSALKKIKDWPAKPLEALEILDKKQQERFFSDAHDVDNQLYDGFFDSADKQAMRLVRQAEPQELGELAAKLSDKRLRALLPLYKARNFAQSLTASEQTTWRQYLTQKLTGGAANSQLARYFSSIETLKTQPRLTKEQKLILSELRLYGENILPD